MSLNIFVTCVTENNIYDGVVECYDDEKNIERWRNEETNQRKTMKPMDCHVLSDIAR